MPVACRAFAMPVEENLGVPPMNFVCLDTRTSQGAIYNQPPATQDIILTSHAKMYMIWISGRSWIVRPLKTDGFACRIHNCQSRTYHIKVKSGSITMDARETEVILVPGVKKHVFS